MASDSVQLIKERLSIVDVVSSYVELHKAGKNYKGKSPFTAEKTPSFYVSPDRGMYYCFSSSQGGDMFTFIEKMEGLEFKDALKFLADKAGVELVKEDPKKRTERERMYDVLEEATAFFYKQGQTNTDVLAYLTNRGVTAETIAKWRIGYAPGPPLHGWRALKEHMEAKGFTKAELLKAGLIKGADAGKEPYDLFRDRIMFPIFDAGGKVVAYSGRILTQGTEAPKYVNSPETELFNKSEILYGYHIAKQGIRNLDFALAVEGQFDVVLSHQAGYSNTVAVSGTALTPHHVMLLQRLSNRVVLSLDADKAGIAAVKRAADLMLPRGIDLKVANIVGGKDPADLIAEDVQKFRKVIGSAKPIVEYLLDILEAVKKDDRSFKLTVREEILPLLIKISNRIDQEHFEQVIAQRLGTTKDAIHFEVERLLEKTKDKKPEVIVSESVVAGSADFKDQRMQTKRKEELKEYLAVLVTLFDGKKSETLRLAFKEATQEDAEVAYTTLKSETTSALLFSLESYIVNVSAKQLAEEVSDKLNELSRAVAKEKIQDLQEKLAQAEEEGDDTRIGECLTAISSVQKDRNTNRFDMASFI